MRFGTEHNPTQPVAGVCAQCGRAVRNVEPYSYVESIVWERIGARGRGRHITSRKTTGRVVCPTCVPEADTGAELLFDV